MTGTLPPPDARDRLRELAAASVGSDRLVVRVEADLAAAPDLIKWLGGYPDQVQLYCANRSRTLTVAALGVADRMRRFEPGGMRIALDEVRERLASLPDGARYYGGFEFAPRRHDDPMWSKVGASMFILPAVEILRTEDRVRMAFNLPGEDPVGALEAAFARLDAPTSDQAATNLPARLGRRDTPDRAGWTERVSHVLARISTGEVRKVVLARQTDLAFAAPLDPGVLVRGMADAPARSFLFFFNYAGELAFLGATPELLCRRHGSQVFTEALAGTRPRSENPAEDASLAGELMTRPKLVEEHQLVEAHVAGCLEACCDGGISREGPEVLKLTRLQHRVTRFSGQVRAEIHDADLLERLHPTPAVAGDPVPEALAMIRDLEPFDRGWYAGPIGWVARDGMEFAVALRCGLIAGDKARLYAGAGLVAESNAEDEWTEIDIKMDQFLNLLHPA